MQRNYYNGHGFWQVEPKYKRVEYLINDKIIKKAENELNIKFPQSFIDLMKINNGGKLKYPYFVLPAGERVKLPSIEPIHFENDDISILSSEKLLNEVNLPTGFIVLWTDFHYWVVLDYRGKQVNPSVMYIAENFSASTFDTTEWEYIKITDTFDEFSKQLFC